MTVPSPHFGNLMVPLDGSHLAESILPAVDLLATRFQSKVTLLHIIEQHAPATIHGERHLTELSEAESYIANVASRLASKGVKVNTHVHGAAEGDVVRSIVAHAQEIAADLVMMCTHGSGGLRDLFFGSIAQQVLQRWNGALFLMPPRVAETVQAFQIRQILVPLDGTPVHEPALPVASTLALAFTAAMHLVFVVPTVATLSGEQAVPGRMLPVTMTAILDLAQQGAVSYLDQVMARCRAEGIPVSAEIMRGHRVERVLDLAERIDADILVMASHGRAGLDAFLARSVAPRITGKSGCPILLVKVGED